ncbi:MAG TPA: cytochrome c [Vicinamibacterales bacterium]|nr:cytochrome c [Vicinamibacterales bacterium]
MIRRAVLVIAGAIAGALGVVAALGYGLAALLRPDPAAREAVRRRWWRGLAWKAGIVVALAALAAAGGLFVIYSGIYNVASTEQHTPPVYWAFITSMRHSIAERADGIQAPPLDDPVMVRNGLELYRRHCLQCHGAPGVAPHPVALGLTPLPANLVVAGRQWFPEEVYWTVKNGIKMTGMPAWEYRMTEQELWSVVAFVKRMPSLSPAQYRAMTGEAERDGRPDGSAR